jgi:glucokinase
MVQFPVLLGDIGGTNARFAVLGGPHEPVLPLPSTLTARHRSPVEAIRSALDGQDVPSPRSAFIAVATRVDAPAVRLTNAPWLIDAGEIGRCFGLSRVALVNDYVPVAASLTALRDGHRDLARLGPDLADDGGAKLVIGPGTGLGAAALLPFGERFAIQSTEAAHVDFGPSDEGEAALWPSVERVGGRITAETILSGPGLLRLYHACARSRGRAAVCATPEAVAQAGLDGGDDLAGDVLRLFARLLGRFAGDLALIFGATGGVFIGGGIAPTIVTILEAGHFRAGFEDKSPYNNLMRSIPAHVIMQPVPAFAGLAAIASSPDRFLFAEETWASSPPDRKG